MIVINSSKKGSSNEAIEKRAEKRPKEASPLLAAVLVAGTLLICPKTIWLGAKVEEGGLFLPQYYSILWMECN